jgi:N-acetyl-D-muramate 6-phosphate phosphatase
MTEGVLFDLDGTLADTAPDLAAAINRLRSDHGLEAIPLQQLRPHVSSGARGMLRAAFDLKPTDEGYADMVQRFLAHYEKHLCVDTQLFDGMPSLLDAIDGAGIPWGIVTNKQSRFTLPLVAALGLEKRACCIVSGDSAARPKPAPDSLLLACSQAGISPQGCVYVGDDLRDVVAGKAARMRTVAVAYGYLGIDDPIESWGADAIIDTPAELGKLIGLEADVRDSMRA